MGGPSPPRSSHICPACPHHCVVLLYLGSPQSTFWWAVSTAFVTHLPCVPTPLRGFLVFRSPTIHLLVGRRHRIRHIFARVPTHLLVLIANSFPQNPPFGGSATLYSSHICSAHKIVCFYCGRVSPGLSPLHSLHTGPHANTIACFIAISFCQNPPFGGPSSSHSSHICRACPRNYLFLMPFVFSKSTFWRAVSIAFVTHLPACPNNCLCLIQFRFPQIHLLVARLHRIR